MAKRDFRWMRVRRAAVILFFLLGALFLIVPDARFDRPLSTVVESSDRQLLGAHIASDGQWRFPLPDSLPDKYLTCLINFEDRYFYYHPGINPVSIVRSLVINYRNHRIVSGGSTITMQVARMSGNNPPRTIVRKLFEMIMAVKMEIIHSKQNILLKYAANAPFGGNVVGIEAASWRYFGRKCDEISWSEAALLAVLPNAPSLIYPGRNNKLLIDKRNTLLEVLRERGEIDSLTCSLAIEEPLPEALHKLPRLTPVVVDRLLALGEGRRYITTIDFEIQRRVNELAEINQKVNGGNEVHNIAAIVIDVETGAILAYTGNISTETGDHSGEVDMITAPRSTGSILKPFLYAGMLESGELTPDMLVRDVPVEFSGYSPKNFDLSYNGAVKASAALSRSLNVPAVEMLRVHTPDRFLLLLNQLGFTTFSRDADHYGLSLILGGGEATLLELTGCYSMMASIINHANDNSFNKQGYSMPSYIESDLMNPASPGPFPLSAAAIWCTFKAMKEVNRPDDYAGWKNFSSSGSVAWKTGTSFGFRDAWAIGVCPQYAIGVWAGNADGEGRTGLTGVGSAAPLLFDIIDMLNPDEWFSEPEEGLIEVEICRESGHRASPYCENIVLQKIPRQDAGTPPCPYHIQVHMSEDSRYQVTKGCYPGEKILHSSWFVLPPAQEWYYRKGHMEYKTLPPFLQGCEDGLQVEQIELLYPRNLGGIYVPLENDGQRGRVVFEAAHRSPREKLFWHLDDKFVAETSIIHQVALNPAPGKHLLTVMDSRGNVLETRFVVIEK
ncbi:MAG: penicillin-binding protein 1C [Bacteroidia bacterium]|nr:MAG: penicillin-binding protein 1C [Bacteroidia bacterium]